MKMKLPKKADQYIQADATDSAGELVRLRLPWLVVGLVGGTFASYLVSRFETILEQNIALAFFLPLVVYMSDAVGTQTATIYIRNLARKQVGFAKSLVKELLVGIALGAAFGFILGVTARIWIGSPQLAWTVGLAMFATVASAPVIALAISSLLYKEHTDPALGSGPFATIIQDIVSITIYLLIASFILFGGW